MLRQTWHKQKQTKTYFSATSTVQLEQILAFWKNAITVKENLEKVWMFVI